MSQAAVANRMGRRLRRQSLWCPACTREAEWVDNEAYLYGFALLRAGYYWEAHEVWEPVWLASPPNGRARTLLRALIQTANAHLKIKMNRPRAVVRLAQEARRELVGLGVANDEAFMGVVISTLCAELDALAGAPSADGDRSQ